MGFGSYDESEQETQSSNAGVDDEAAVSVHEYDHDGTVSVESGDSTDELLDQLGTIKDQQDSD